MEWKLKLNIESIGAIQFVSNDRLAICREDRAELEVHQVTRESTHLLYKLTCDEWRGDYPRSMAVSDSMTDSILVIQNRYVYQFPCQESVEYVKKYEVHTSD